MEILVKKFLQPAKFSIMRKKDVNNVSQIINLIKIMFVRID